MDWLRHDLRIALGLRFFYTPGGIERAETVKQRVAKLPRRVLSMISQDFAVRALGGYSLLVLAK